MSLHKDSELKAAVLNLPPKEKDKLLVRLISKDKMLIKQLHFQLLEDEVDLEERINALRERLNELFEPNRSGIKNVAMYSHYRALTVLLRQASGMINEHEKVTKDKFSESEFRLLILEAAFEHYPILFQKTYVAAADKLQRYVAARLKTTFNKYDKLHEDLQFDLKESYEKVLAFAEEHGLIIS
ncbi:hypothetical protein [Sphingobacterium bovistauri]|uniref:Uncharacterized protein n=1 Tax=Sphingobacterium bovistauri TaxID=2781959 RepID=A0ABS7Z3P3_9SPHI|nr:hypothetical protein [Sphingobacterium bovistauri]MCA5004182.1 hypothetical protein [Sphingobacterium bovistauri]